MNMGQYYKLVNTSKKEVVNPWDLGGVAKAWEWLLSDTLKALPWVLFKSSQTKGSKVYEVLGGGDIANKGYTTLGRWAGDKITLVGDYDASGLYKKAEKYEDISLQVVEDVNNALKADGGEDNEWIRDHLLGKKTV